MWLFLALVMVPVVEIGLFIQVGGAIGLWPTLLIVVLTAFLGSQLIRRQGIGAFLALRSSVSELRDPTRALFDGAMILFSGALLLTPGFLTDTIGLILLIPRVRAAIYAAVRRRIEVVAFDSGPRPQQTGPGDVIDAEYERLDDDPPSGADPRH